MPKIAAVILADDHADLRYAGMSLLRRATRTAARLGVQDVRVVHEADRTPFADLPGADVIVVLPTGTIIQPAALAGLLRDRMPQDDEAVLVTDWKTDRRRFLQLTAGRITSVMTDGNAASTGIVLLSPGAAERIRNAPGLREALHRLSARTALVSATVAPRFCERLIDPAEVPELERRYLRHTSGGDGEGRFTRNIRFFSVPLTRLLLHFPVTANAVTMTSLVLAVATGIAFACGGYWAGVLGALLYFASMVCDCSDGEVARATLGDSKFGAWLETVTDYLSYFLVLGGIVWSDTRAEGFCHHTRAAIVAAAASVAIVLLVGYQRARTASDNPGAFDDALAEELQRGTWVQRFTGWSRQLIKRSFFAHLLLFQAVIGHLRALTEIWAYGAVAALVLVLFVHLHLVRNLRVASAEQLVTVNS